MKKAILSLMFLALLFPLIACAGDTTTAPLTTAAPTTVAPTTAAPTTATPTTVAPTTAVPTTVELTTTEPEPVIEEVTDRVFEDWGTFTGTLVDGKPLVGTVVADGFTYAGTYEDNWVITGTGVLTWADGTVIEGPLVNKNLNGYGKTAWTNGCVGIGLWEEGMLNGDAYFIWPQANGKVDIHHGLWEDFVRKGVGYYYFSDGTYYYGMFNDWINGPGTMYWTNGNRWAGNFVGGSPEKGTTGFGVMDGTEGWIAVDSETGAWSIGEEVVGWEDPSFEDPEPIDYHALYSVDADVVDHVYEDFGTFTGKLVEGVPSEGYLVGDGFTYAGTFEDGWLITGNGILMWPDGSKSEGPIVNKKLHGWGRTDFNNGCVGIGFWQDGMLDGEAFFQWRQPNGRYDVHYGSWEDFVRKGEGLYFFTTGVYYDGMFNDWINGEGTMYWPGGNRWEGNFVGGSPEKGTTGFGVMDGTEGWIAVDSETGAWSWGTAPEVE